MTAIVMGYVTCKDKTEATSIATQLLEERLIACANIYENMTAVYRWNEKVETSPEITLILKTQSQHQDAIASRIKELHSYECPCVLFYPASHGLSDYLKWVQDET